MQLSQYLSMRVAPPSCTSYLTSWEGMPLHTQQGDPSVSLLIVSCLLLYIKHSDDTIFSSPSSTSFGILSFLRYLHCSSIRNPACSFDLERTQTENTDHRNDYIVEFFAHTTLVPNLHLEFFLPVIVCKLLFITG